MTNDALAQHAFAMATQMHPIFRTPDAKVEARIRAMANELDAISPDPRLVDLRARSAAELEAVERRSEEVGREIGDAELAAALGDAVDAKRLGGLRKQAADLRAQADAIRDRIAALDRKVAADERGAIERKAQFARDCSHELNAMRGKRTEDLAEGLREALALIGSFRATDEALLNTVGHFNLKLMQLQREASLSPEARAAARQPQGSPPGVSRDEE